MKRINEALPGLLELELDVHGDARGSFCESFSQRTMAGLGIDETFVQDNESHSIRRGTVRGLHLQRAPHAQGKLVRVLRGAIFDVAVDLRTDSPTFRRHATVELAEDDARVFWIPAGFAHGFCTLADDTIVGYKATAYYAPDAERTIRFDDPDLGIDWPVDPREAVLSDRDAEAPPLARFLEEIA